MSVLYILMCSAVFASVCEKCMFSTIEEVYAHHPESNVFHLLSRMPCAAQTEVSSLEGVSEVQSRPSVAATVRSIVSILDANPDSTMTSDQFLLHSQIKQVLSPYKEVEETLRKTEDCLNQEIAREVALEGGEVLTVWTGSITPNLQKLQSEILQLLSFMQKIEKLRLVKHSSSQPTNLRQFAENAICALVDCPPFYASTLNEAEVARILEEQDRQMALCPTYITSQLRRPAQLSMIETHKRVLLQSYLEYAHLLDHPSLCSGRHRLTKAEIQFSERKRIIELVCLERYLSNTQLQEIERRVEKLVFQTCQECFESASKEIVSQSSAPLLEVVTLMSSMDKSGRSAYNVAMAILSLPSETALIEQEVQLLECMRYRLKPYFNHLVSSQSQSLCQEDADSPYSLQALQGCMQSFVYLLEHIASLRLISSDNTQEEGWQDFAAKGLRSLICPWQELSQCCDNGILEKVIQEQHKLMFFASVPIPTLANFDLHQIAAHYNSVLMRAYICFASEHAIHKKLPHREQDISAVRVKVLEEGRILRRLNLDYANGQVREQVLSWHQRYQDLCSTECEACLNSAVQTVCSYPYSTEAPQAPLLRAVKILQSEIELARGECKASPIIRAIRFTQLMGQSSVYHLTMAICALSPDQHIWPCDVAFSGCVKESLEPLQNLLKGTSAGIEDAMGEAMENHLSELQSSIRDVICFLRCVETFRRLSDDSAQEQSVRNVAKDGLRAFLCVPCEYAASSDGAIQGLFGSLSLQDQESTEGSPNTTTDVSGNNSLFMQFYCEFAARHKFCPHASCREQSVADVR